MTRFFRAFVLCALAFSLAVSGVGTALANIDSYSALLDAVSQANNDDILIITGVIAADESDPPLRSDVNVIIRGEESSIAELIGVRIDSMNVGFSNVSFPCGLEIQGNSNVQLMSGTRAEGNGGSSAITMVGSGTLHIDRGSAIIGGANASGQGGDGILLQASTGDIALVIEGSVIGGTGRTGGSAITLSGLNRQSSVSVGGVIAGGDGTRIGGNGVNLYDSTDSASVYISGMVTGGTGGRTGGSAVQIVNVSGAATVELTGSARGGNGAYYGGDTLVAMNVEGSLVLSGQLRGGDVSSNGQRPGAAVRLLDVITTQNTSMNNAMIEDGQVLPAAATPIPKSEPTAALTAEPTLEPTVEPTAAPSEAPADVPADEAAVEASEESAEEQLTESEDEIEAETVETEVVETEETGV